jgi:glucose-6-phosphate-specific signal transduction histidine kinase
MSDGALIFLALLTSLAGMGTLALSIEAHWRQVMSTRVQTASARRRLRLAGATLLAIAILLCAAADPLSMAALVWPMLLTVAGAIVAASLTLHARLSARDR